MVTIKVCYKSKQNLNMVHHIFHSEAFSILFLDYTFVYQTHAAVMSSSPLQSGTWLSTFPATLYIPRLYTSSKPTT